LTASIFCGRGDARSRHRLGQAPGPVQVPAKERGFCGFGQPAGSSLCFTAQLGSALPGGRSLQGCALTGRQVGGGAERGGSRVIRADRGRGQMPGGTLGIMSGHGFRQRRMRSAALRRDGEVIRHGPQQRMEEFDPGAGQADQADGFGLSQGVVVDGAQAGGRGTHVGWRAATRRGRDQEQGPNRRAEPVQARGEALPDGLAGLKRCPGKFGADKLLRGQSGRQLYERQGITAGLGV
jgi:hypothetical protein